MRAALPSPHNLYEHELRLSHAPLKASPIHFVASIEASPCGSWSRHSTLPRLPTMDSPLVSHIFRQLFRHRHPGCLQNLRDQGLRHGSGIVHGRRTYSTRQRASKDRGMKTNESRWQQRTTLLPADRSAEFAQYPHLSIQDLKKRKERPLKAKMLLRDFIDGKFIRARTEREWMKGVLIGRPWSRD